MTEELEVEQVHSRPTIPQARLIISKKQFPAFVAGFGSGKTSGLIERCMMLKTTYPTCNVAYYLPTYDLVRTIAFPRFREKLADMGWLEREDFTVVQSLTPMIKLRDCGEIIFRTMDNPDRIIGYEVADSFIDELDTLKEKDAENAWRKILARNRQKKPDGSKNTIAVGTTPEGFKFVYKRWEKEPPTDEYHLIRASTYSNQANLPAGYIENLIADYPSNLIAAYINGEFVNLTSGAVYPSYDRILNRSIETIRAGEWLHIGMDFNVGKMSAIVWVYRDGWPHAVAEIVKVLDTPAMIEALKRRFPNNPIWIYPDATGGNRKSNNASSSDISLLRQANFNVSNNPTNPFVKDRVLAVNVLIEANGVRRLKVNDEACPTFAESLEKQAYDDKGEPDKTTGFDHTNDAGGYFIAYRFPVLNGKVVKQQLGGV